jgi:hypothetical protein
MPREHSDYPATQVYRASAQSPTHQEAREAAYDAGRKDGRQQWSRKNNHHHEEQNTGKDGETEIDEERLSQVPRGRPAWRRPKRQFRMDIVTHSFTP